MIRHKPNPFPFDQLEMLLKKEIGACFHLTDKAPGLKEMLKLRLNRPVVFFDEMNLGLSVPGNPQNVSYPALGGLLSIS